MKNELLSIIAIVLITVALSPLSAQTKANSTAIV